MPLHDPRVVQGPPPSLALVRGPDGTLGYYPVQAPASPWPWVVLGLALLGVVVWLVSRSTSAAPQAPAGAGLTGGDPAWNANYIQLPYWAEVATTVLARAPNGSIIHGYILALEPYGMLKVRVRRIDGAWQPGQPRVDDILLLPAAALISKSRI